MKTLECSLLSIDCLMNMIYKGWLEAPIIFSSSSKNELGMVQIIDYSSF